MFLRLGNLHRESPASHFWSVTLDLAYDRRRAPISDNKICLKAFWCVKAELICTRSYHSVHPSRGNHLAFSCDVGKEQDVQNTFKEMEKHLGPVNFLVNAAGINRDRLLVRTKTEDMISQLHTNLLGSMLTCKAAMRTMIEKGGSIVNVGSVIGLKGNVGQCAYSASKGGIIGFSRSLAKEVARKKVRVNVVAPVSESMDQNYDL